MMFHKVIIKIDEVVFIDIDNNEKIVSISVGQQGICMSVLNTPFLGETEFIARIKLKLTFSVTF